MDLKLFVASLTVYEKQEILRLLKDTTGTVEERALAIGLSGRKVDAMKLLRQELGWGLREAKDFIESAGKVLPAYMG